ncbi:MAG: glycosyltransferase [Actinomycetota bacterium]|nr:glycosyltransferase [Actinomycetota bacterium]
MNLLVVSPEYASHYGPLAVLAGAARATGARVVVATGPSLRPRVEEDGFEWTLLRLGASSNAGVVADSPEIDAFLAATRAGPVATIRHQALARQRDLLWEPERIAREIGELCEQLDPDEVLVDHVSFGSTLAMYATGRSFVTLVPGHPSQLPVGAERYGIPAMWPSPMAPDRCQLDELQRLADDVTRSFTDRWNEALAAVSPQRPPVADAFRVHGRRVLYNSVAGLHSPARGALLPGDHRFVGPLVRDEQLPAPLRSWLDRTSDRPQVYVALGTFLSHRSDVLARVAGALRHLGARAAIAIGATPLDELGQLPDDWTVAASLPQVAMLRAADLVIHHGGNNSVQESLAAGIRQLVVPMSTDQFANAADLERTGAGSVAAPNAATCAELADSIALLAARPRPSAILPPDQRCLCSALFD